MDIQQIAHLPIVLVRDSVHLQQLVKRNRKGRRLDREFDHGPTTCTAVATMTTLPFHSEAREQLRVVTHIPLALDDMR